MSEDISVDRRALLRAGLAVSAVTASGLVLPMTAESALAADTEGDVEAAAAPKIYSTKDWKARKESSPIQILNKKPTILIIHHTATGNSGGTTLSSSYALAKSIQNYHMDSNKWSDTGQHFTNTRGGYRLEGRHHSLSSLQSGKKHVVGAHCKDKNEESVGIENQGTYTSSTPPKKLWDSLVSLSTYICKQYGISAKNIKGHRDYNSTECPGKVLYGKLPALRKAVGAKMGQYGVDVEVDLTWPLLMPGDTGVRVKAAQLLLRASGAAHLAADGVFAESTARAVREFEAKHGITVEPCYATAHASESGLLGAGAWPLLAPTVRQGQRGEAAAAAELLRRAKGRRSAAGGDNIIDQRDWQDLLS